MEYTFALHSADFLSPLLPHHVISVSYKALYNFLTILAKYLLIHNLIFCKAMEINFQYKYSLLPYIYIDFRALVAVIAPRSPILYIKMHNYS